MDQIEKKMIDQLLTDVFSSQSLTDDEKQQVLEEGRTVGRN